MTTMVIEIPESKIEQTREILESLGWVKNIEFVNPKEITNPIILKEIEEVENGTIIPTPFNPDSLLKYVNA